MTIDVVRGVLLCFERPLINFENNTRINVVRGVLIGFGWLTNVFQRLHSKLLNFDMSKFNAKIGRGGFEKQLSHSASDSRQVSLLLPALAVVRVCFR